MNTNEIIDYIISNNSIENLIRREIPNYFPYGEYEDEVEVEDDED